MARLSELLLFFFFEGGVGVLIDALTTSANDLVIQNGGLIRRREGEGTEGTEGTVGSLALGSFLVGLLRDGDDMVLGFVVRYAASKQMKQQNQYSTLTVPWKQARRGYPT